MSQCRIDGDHFGTEAMTTNQTIDGVPRELLERLLYDLPNERTKGELRALLDTPAKPVEGLEADNKKLAADRASLSTELEALRKAYRGVLAQLDAAQPRREPVAWGFVNEDGEPDATARWDVAKHLPMDVTPLYAEQTAPVAVVLPERKAVSVGVLSESNTHNQGWNACLDELKRLNPSL